MLNYKLFAVLAIVLASGIFYEDAFAMFSPIQPNAYVSYNSVDNEIQVEWDFTTGGVDAPQTCLLKGDFWYYTDLNNAHGTDQSESDNQSHQYYDHVTYVKGFTPIHYSVVSSSPTVVGTDKTTEVIPCTGSARIDMDIVMSHPSNVKLDGVTPREDLQIFLSFYALDANTAITLETFAFQSSTYMEQIFVFYTPDVTWNDGAKDYACDGEPGNVLYLDGSGIHGNNGDNCSKYETLADNQWVDIGGDNNAASLADGVTATGFHNEPFFSLLIKVVEQITALVTSNGGDDDHNSRPTFGMDHKRNEPRVDTGLAINGMPYPILDNFHTDMPFVAIHIGEIQNFTAKVYAPHSLKIMEFLFGIPEQGSWNEAEASIEILTNYNGDALGEDITQSLTSPIINATSLQYSISKVKCLPSDNTEPCYRVSLEFSFLERPLGNVVALQAIDESRKNQISYFNDGLDITGESLNPPVTQEIISDIKYNGLQTIQRIDKVNDVWVTLDKSEPVLTYQQNDHGTFIALEYRFFEKTPDVMTSNPDRLHSEFIKSIKFEQKRAVQYFDSALYLGQLDPAWSHHWKETDRMVENKDAIEAETKRTQEVYEESYPDYEKAKTNH